MEISNDDHGRERVKAFRAVFNKAIALPEDEIRDYLNVEFAGKGEEIHDLFCQFVGFVSAALKSPDNKTDKIKIIDFYNSLVMEGISRGRQDGFNGAKRIYSSTGHKEAS